MHALVRIILLVLGAAWMLVGGGVASLLWLTRIWNEGPIRDGLGLPLTPQPAWLSWLWFENEPYWHGHWEPVVIVAWLLWMAMAGLFVELATRPPKETESRVEVESSVPKALH